MHGCAAVHGVFVQLRGQVHRHFGEHQRVTQGYQIAGLLRPHDAGNARDAQHITLAVATFDDQPQGLRLHANPTLGHRHALGDGLFTDVDHVGLACAVEMG